MLILSLLTGCATFAFPANRGALGFVYTDAYTPQALTPNAIGKKKGEACATSVLGIVTTGEAGIRDAADAAGITHISSVDTTFRNILGVWSRYCTIVSGDDLPPDAPEPAPAEPAPAEPAPAESAKPVEPPKPE